MNGDSRTAVTRLTAEQQQIIAEMKTSFEDIDPEAYWAPALARLQKFAEAARQVRAKSYAKGCCRVHS